jgi:hypothetical protein
MIFFHHMTQNEAILGGILHQRGSQDVFEVARFLTKIVGVAGKKKFGNPWVRFYYQGEFLLELHQRGP